MNIIKNKLTPIISVGLLYLILIYCYILKSYPDVVFCDGFFILKHIKDIYNNNITFYTLVPKFGEHLLPFWLFVNLCNTKYLLLDMRVDAFVSLFSYIIVYLLICYQVCIINNLKNSYTWIASIIIGFVSFSLVQPPCLLMASQFSMASAIGLAAALLFDKIVKYNGNLSLKKWILYIFIVFLYFFTSGAYFAGFLAGLFAMNIFYVWSHRSKVELFRLAILDAIVSANIILYLYLIKSSESKTDIASAEIISKIFHIKETFLWVLTGLGASLVDRNTLEDAGLSMIIVPALGLIFFMFMFLMFFSLWHKKITILNSTLIYCFFYPLGISIAVRLGRGQLGSYEWISNDWYSFHFKFYAITLLGLVFVIFATWAHHHKLIRFIAILASVLYLTISIISNLSQINRSKHVHAWLAAKQAAILDSPSVERTQLLLWDRESVDEGISFMEKNKLGPFNSKRQSLSLNASIPNVKNWGPRETEVSTRFNIQPSGLSAMWVTVEGVSRHPKTHVTFGEYRIEGLDLSVQDKVVTFVIDDNLIAQSGVYEVAIIEGNSGRKIVVGDFIVKPM